MSQQKKFGLALGSGGPKGLVHVGVIKELVKNDIRIDFIAGTSIGAWVGAHYALFQDVKSLEEITVGRRKEKFFALLDVTLKGGLIYGDKVRKILTGWLNDSKFSDTKIPFRCVATDLIAGKEKIFSRGLIVPAIQASMAVPSLFRPVLVDNSYYVDGGLINPVPDDVVRKMGADVVLAINLDNCQTKKGFNLKNISSISRVANRSMEILRHHLAEATLSNSDFVIRPQMKDVEISIWKDYFLGKYGPELVRIGERETRKIINDLKKALK